ncbi:gallidermin/nisin family lantibiotic [Clostridium rectalis]|nr:gallidermin/nisin family lantibiotic [Clostridium rectalis]
MGKLNDFDLDLKVKETTKKGVEPTWKSKSFCTPGCVTGILMTCTSNGCK